VEIPGADSTLIFGIQPDPLLHAVFLTALAALAVSATLLVITALLRVRLMARQRSVQRMQARWRPILTSVAAGEAVDPPPIQEAERRLLLGLWNHLRESVKGDAALQLETLARELGLDATALAQLTTGTVPERLFAINTLGHLRTPAAWAPLMLLRQGEATIMSLAAVQALLRMDAERALPELLAQILDRDDWSITRLLPLLKAIDPVVLQQALLAELPGTSGAASRRLLILAEVLPTELAAPLAHQVIASTDDEEQLAAALRLLGDPRDAPLVRRFLSHPNWRIRVRAVSALEKVGGEDDLPKLITALSDREWWVRLRAARALVRLPFMDNEQLRRLQNDMQDRFARDALNQVMLEERPQ